MTTDTTDDSQWEQHEDLPILLNASYFEQKPVDSTLAAEEFKRFTCIYAQRVEEHIAHLVSLLEMKGITCQCTDHKTSPQCLIHVRDNV